MIEVSRMRASDINSVLEIANLSALETWSRQDYLSELRRRDSLALVGKINSQTITFCVSRLITFQSSQQSTFINEVSKSVNSSVSGNVDNNVTVVNPALETECEIYNIAVREEFRNRGFANHLLNTLVSLTKTHHTRAIWLEVRESNAAAVNFYRKNGFRRIYERKNFYSNPTENAVVMKKNYDAGAGVK